MSTNQWKLGSQWPVSVDSVEICVADTRVLDIDENFIRAGLLDWDLLVDDSYKELVSPGEKKLWYVSRTYVLRSSQQPGPIAQLGFVVMAL
jgi:hypothetical protein